MKSAHAWVACSLVSAGVALLSCGSDDGKKTLAGAPAGAGGEPSESGGGAGGDTPVAVGGSVPIGEGGHAGETPQSAEGGAGAAPVSSGGMGGEGGTVTPPLCFDLLTASAGGAGAGAGGAEAAPTSQPSFRFRCDDLALGYVVDSAQSTVALTLGLKHGSGLLPAVSGDISYHYYYTVDDVQQTFCAEHTPVQTSQGVLAFPADDTIDELYIRALKVTDECSNEIALDTSLDPGYCWVAHVQPANQSWFIDCYEGYGDDCLETCPIPNP